MLLLKRVLRTWAADVSSVMFVILGISRTEPLEIEKMVVRLVSVLLAKSLLSSEIEVARLKD